MDSGSSPGFPGGGAQMPTSVKTMTVCTVTCLVAATAYSIALGANGWIWFAWVVLGLATAGVFLTVTRR